MTSLKNKNKIRRMIKHFFTDRDWVTVVRPVENEKELQHLNHLSEQDLRPKFIEQIKSVKRRIFNNVKPKILNGKILNGSMLLELWKSYVNAINDGKVPWIENAWSYVLRHELEKNMRQIIKEYQLIMTRLMPVKSDNYCVSLLHSLHKKVANDLLVKFKSDTMSDQSKSYENQILKEIDEAFQMHIEDCESKQQECNEKFIKTWFDKIQVCLRKDPIKSRTQLNKCLGTQNLDYHTLFRDFEQDKAKSSLETASINKKNATLKSTIKMLEEKLSMAEKYKRNEIKSIKHESDKVQQEYHQKLAKLTHDNDKLISENTNLKEEISRIKSKYEDLKKSK